MVKGTLLKTAVGQVEVIDISESQKNDIDARQAKLAGYDELTELLALLDNVKEGSIYQIKLRYHSLDPRIELRAKADLSDEDLELLRRKLDRLDLTGKYGAWTINVLKAIEAHPHLRAIDLAETLDLPKDWLKINIRKL